MAMSYGNVYVAQVAFGAKDVQTLRTFLEAESYDGPSLIICYSPCIAQGIDLSNNIRQTGTGYRLWTLATISLRPPSQHKKAKTH